MNNKYHINSIKYPGAIASYERGCLGGGRFGGRGGGTRKISKSATANVLLIYSINSLTTNKQTTKFSAANFQKM